MGIEKNAVGPQIDSVVLLVFQQLQFSIGQPPDILELVIGLSRQLSGSGLSSPCQQAVGALRQFRLFLQPGERHKHVERRGSTGAQAEIGQLGIGADLFDHREPESHGEIFRHRERRIPRQHTGLGDAQAKFIAGLQP